MRGFGIVRCEVVWNKAGKKQQDVSFVVVVVPDPLMAPVTISLRYSQMRRESGPVGLRKKAEEIDGLSATAARLTILPSDSRKITKYLLLSSLR